MAAILSQTAAELLNANKRASVQFLSKVLKAPRVIEFSWCAVIWFETSAFPYLVQAGTRVSVCLH